MASKTLKKKDFRSFIVSHSGVIHPRPYSEIGLPQRSSGLFLSRSWKIFLALIFLSFIFPIAKRGFILASSNRRRKKFIEKLFQVFGAFRLICTLFALQKITSNLPCSHCASFKLKLKRSLPKILLIFPLKASSCAMNSLEINRRFSFILYEFQKSFYNYRGKLKIYIQNVRGKPRWLLIDEYLNNFYVNNRIWRDF